MAWSEEARELRLRSALSGFQAPLPVVKNEWVRGGLCRGRAQPATALPPLEEVGCGLEDAQETADPAGSPSLVT